MTSHIYDIAIIGAGAAGLMAAIEASGADTVLLEKMPRPARKILVTGKGRCNITNMSRWNEFCTHVHPSPNPLKHSFSAFSSEDVRRRFEEIGLECTLERGNRLFPASGKAMDVADALVRAAKESGASIVTGFRAESVSRTDDGIFITRSDRGSEVRSRTVIISTGGMSYPSTGSEGDGYGIARGLGHSTTQLFPSLTALVPEGYGSRQGMLLRGIHLANVELTLYCGKDAVQSEFGELDFTDGGIEGALGFRVSRKAVKALTNGDSVKVSIDLKPAIGEEELRSKETQPLDKLLPGRIARAFEATAASAIRSRGLAYALKHWEFRIVSHVGYERAVVTAGGIRMGEINPKTMESKLVGGLFFAGEVTDLDGDTGGYNLQIAWCTGANAGRSAKEYAANKKG